LQELMVLKVGFVSLSEALDLTTPSGRASRPRQGGHCAGSQRRAAAWSPGDRRQKGAWDEEARQERSEQIRDRQAAQRRAHVSPSFAGRGVASLPSNPVPLLLKPQIALFDFSHIFELWTFGGHHERSRGWRMCSPFWREESPGSNRRYFLWQLDLIAFDPGNLALVKEKMLRVESIFLDQPDTIAFNLLYNANMLAVSVDNFHVFADIHSFSP
jgi:hypothetical protein